MPSVKGCWAEAVDGYISASVTHEQEYARNAATFPAYAGSRCAYPRKMARLSWPGWPVTCPRTFRGRLTTIYALIELHLWYEAFHKHKSGTAVFWWLCNVRSLIDRRIILQK